MRLSSGAGGACGALGLAGRDQLVQCHGRVLGCCCRDSGSARNHGNGRVLQRGSEGKHGVMWRGRGKRRMPDEMRQGRGMWDGTDKGGACSGNTWRGMCAQQVGSTQRSTDLLTVWHQAGRPARLAAGPPARLVEWQARHGRRVRGTAPAAECAAGSGWARRPQQPSRLSVRHEILPSSEYCLTRLLRFFLPLDSSHISVGRT